MIEKRRRPAFRSRLFLLLFLVPSVLFAVFEDGNLGARSGAMANAICARPHLVENVALNPAAVSTSHRFLSHFNYTNPYSLPELNSSNIYLSSGFHNFSIAAGLHSFGNEKYAENLGTLALSYKPENSITIGGAIRYGTLEIQSYGQAGTLILDAGILIELMDSLYWGSAIRNLSDSKIGQSGEELPQTILTGLNYNPVKQLAVSLDLVKDVSYPTEIRTGVEYNPIPLLFLRAGVSTEPQRMTAGFGLNFSFGGIDYGYNSHSDLGITHLYSVWFVIK